MQTTDCITCPKSVPEVEGRIPYCDACRPVEKKKYLDWLTGIWSGAPKVRNHVVCSLDSPDPDSHGATFETLNARQPGLQAKVMPFLDGEIHMLAFMGPAGTGKTWASWATLFGWKVKNFDRMGSNHRVIDWPDLCLTASRCESFGAVGQQAESDLNELKKYGLLIIDEFAISRPINNQFNHIYNILNIRYRKLLPTIITTTQSPAEITATMGSALMSRFNRGIVQFNGKDLRA